MAGFDLYREMEHFTREMDDIFRGLGFGRLLEPPVYRGTGRHPRINLREDGDHVYLEALLPGVDPGELEMSVLKGTLTLAGERRKVEANGATWHRRERGAGRFLRAIDLPVEIDIDRVQADYRDGLLTVSLPKAEKERPRKVEIKAG